MKIAVTGANGFIGRHLLRILASVPAEVTALVRPNTSGKIKHPSIKYIALDVQQPPMDPYSHIGKPDVLVHLAWNSLNNYKSTEHEQHVLPMHYEFLQEMISSGLPALVVSGTCLEYGMQSGALHEALEARPVTAYGRAKDRLRCQLQLLKERHDFSLTWARFFYLYGDGQAEGSLYPQLQHAVARGDDSFDMSGGEQLRDYLPVTSAAYLLAQLSMTLQDIGIINICAGRPISVRTLVEAWIAENHWNIALNLGHYPYPDYEPMAFWGDASKLASYTTTA